MEETDRQRSRERKEQTEEEKERETGGGQGLPFKRECGKSAQEVLLLAAAEGISCQDPQGRPFQMPDTNMPPFCLL